MTIKNLDRRISFTESREAVNENFAALVSELGEKAEVVVGSYTGDDDTTQFHPISLGFKPRFLIIVNKYGASHDDNYNYGGIFQPGVAEPQYGFQFTDDGFAVKNIEKYNYRYSSSYSPYSYIALR